MNSRHVAESAIALWRTFGLRGLAQRTGFEARRRVGAFRATPTPVVGRVARAVLPDEWPFRPDARRVAESTDVSAALERARRVSAGEHEAYRWTWRRRPTTETEWVTHPESGVRFATDLPWWKVPHRDLRVGDIKDVWEPARFAWAYDLARGWMLTGDEAFARAIVDGIATFLRSAEPFRGPQWACGQETSIRAVAWLWAEGACDEASAFDAAARGQLLEGLAWSGERVADAFEYAQSQRNNHGLSEATGLIAIGARLRGADPRAEEWIERGHRALERMMLDQIAPDGWYIQHSFTYARVALDQLTTASRALRAVGRALSTPALDRARALVDCVAACVDPNTGDLPNHGSNDGALVLPLSTRPYRDFRPSLTAAAATFAVSLPDHVEPDAETLAWLRAGEPARHRSSLTPWVRSGDSGWAVAATSGARVFVRAGGYRSRPGHIDPAHVDVWLNGRPAAIDAGTFRYTAPPPWNNGLAALDVHNTIAITGLEAARRGPGFLWLSWPRAAIESAAVVGDEIVVRIDNQSWREGGVTHRRTCTLSASGVLVVDEIRANPAFANPVHVQWLLADGADVSFECSEEAVVSEVWGDGNVTRGWVAPSYAVKYAARSVRLTAVPRAGRLRVVSGFGALRGSTVMKAAIESGAEVSCST